MYYFGDKSSRELATLHPALKEILNRVISIYNFSIISGHRTEEEQWTAYVAGASQRDGITRLSKHQEYPSPAVDLAPWPIDWDDLDRFYELSLAVRGVAAGLGIELIWGGDWKSFPDYGHYELVNHG
jgi:peptidoglycan L-alanyl-D-glutamate endopeptidase CwlK